MLVFFFHQIIIIIFFFVPASLRALEWSRPHLVQLVFDVYPWYNIPFFNYLIGYPHFWFFPYICNQYHIHSSSNSHVNSKLLDRGFIPYRKIMYSLVLLVGTLCEIFSLSELVQWSTLALANQYSGTCPWFALSTLVDFTWALALRQHSWLCSINYSCWRRRHYIHLISFISDSTMMWDFPSECYQQMLFLQSD